MTEEKHTLTKQIQKIVKVDDWHIIDMFLFYPKLKENPNGDPVAKQGDRTTLMPRKNAQTIVRNGEKYYRQKDLYINHYQPIVITKTAESLAMQAKLVFMKNIPIFEKEVIVLSISYQFTPLKSFSKKILEQIKNHVEIPKLTKPDLADNLNKLLMDAFNGVVFKDDSLIWKTENVKKIYSILPGVSIKLMGR